MPDLAKVLYTARIHTAGGRDGTARSSDGRLDVQLSTPGGAGSGTNPEQLFAAGWSACFIGAIRIAAGPLNVALPSSILVDAEIDLQMLQGAYGLAARLTVSLPGVDRATAEALVAAAHEICPYSRATRGNISVGFQVL